MIAKVVNLEIKGDERGSLVALENNYNIPFDVKRVYYIFGTKTGVRRGFHAHKKLKQLAICMHGSCKFLLDNGREKNIVELSKPTEGLLIDDFIWREMFDFSPDCVLVVLADNYYDESDYIRDYNDFIKLLDVR